MHEGFPWPEGWEGILKLRNLFTKKKLYLRLLHLAAFI